MNLKCNSTLEDLRILPNSELPLAGDLTFHHLAILVAGASTAVAVAISLYLILMHAVHYTVPHEQKQIIRILLMVPIYAASSFLSLYYYWHAIYFRVLSDCYEAFAISSFFSLMCHYTRPDLRSQKVYFRALHPVKPWIWPVSWFAKCCGGRRQKPTNLTGGGGGGKLGPWRAPRSGLTWFNIIWTGIYQYCFVRVATTIAAVVTQYFSKYCESSNSPVFGHVWIVAVQSAAVTVAMYVLIQFYVQMRDTPELAPHRPFPKILAIKLVVFLSFWQSMAISIGTSELDFLRPNRTLAYPDIKVGIPALLLCVEMALFAIMHLWAFPFGSYRQRGGGGDGGVVEGGRDHGGAGTSVVGGGAGVFKALWDVINIWDVVKGFGRGMRWLFVGIKNRHHDVSYHKKSSPSMEQGGNKGAGGQSATSSNGTSGGGGSVMELEDLNGEGRYFRAMDTSYRGHSMSSEDERRRNMGMSIVGASTRNTHLPTTITGAGAAGGVKQGKGLPSASSSVYSTDENGGDRPKSAASSYRTAKEQAPPRSSATFYKAEKQLLPASSSSLPPSKDERAGLLHNTQPAPGQLPDKRGGPEDDGSTADAPATTNKRNSQLLERLREQERLSTVSEESASWSAGQQLPPTALRPPPQ